MKIFLVSLVLALLLPAPSRAPTPPALPLAATGASVDQSRVTKTYHVALHGDDANAGTPGQPFQTLGRAVKSAMADKAKNAGVKIVLGAGVYRESVRVKMPQDTPDTSAPLVIEAAQKGTAILSGSDIWTGWQRDGENWTHAWPYAWGLGPEKTPSGKGPIFPPLNRRRELVVVDGRIVRQVLAASELAPNTFFVDEAAKVIALRPGAGADMSRAVVEVAVRTSGLALEGLQNVAVRGVVVRHVGGFMNAPGVLLISNCSNVLLEDCDAVWNNFRGLGGQDIRDLTLRRVRASDNGQIGIQFGRVRNLLAEDCDTSGNNWRGHWAGWYTGWSPCAFKMRWVHVSTWRRHRAVNNFCRGMWWDTDASHILVEDSVMSGNLMSGLFVENNPGPARISRCLITQTRLSPDEASGFQAGLLAQATPDVTLEHNIVWNNDVPQYRLWNLASRNDNVDFETKENYGDKARPQRYTFRNNVFWANGEQMLFVLPLVSKNAKTKPSVPFDFFFNTLSSDRNGLWHAQKRDVFLLGETARDLDGWRAFSGQDRNSLWREPEFADAAGFDFRVKPGSPLASWGLPVGLPPGMAIPPPPEPVNAPRERGKPVKTEAN